MGLTTIAPKEERIFFITCKPYFTIQEEEFVSEDGVSYISYGILAKSAWGKHLQEIKDVSTDKECVKELVHKLNIMHVSVLHLKDVVEDFLAAS